MIDTNSIPPVQAAQAAQQALNAWMIVAAGAGVAVTHAYHTIVAGGGLKTIVGKFWDNTSPRPSPQSGEGANK
jgi:hypothetical protein